MRESALQVKTAAFGEYTDCSATLICRDHLLSQCSCSDSA